MLIRTVNGEDRGGQTTRRRGREDVVYNGEGQVQWTCGQVTMEHEGTTDYALNCSGRAEKASTADVSLVATVIPDTLIMLFFQILLLNSSMN